MVWCLTYRHLIATISYIYFSHQKPPRSTLVPGLLHYLAAVNLVVIIFCKYKTWSEQQSVCIPHTAINLLGSNCTQHKFYYMGIITVLNLKVLHEMQRQ